MKVHSLIHIVVTGTAIVLATQSARAGQPESAPLEKKVQEFYQNMNAGDFEKAFNFLKPGASGFLPEGMLITIPNEEVREKIAQNASAEHAAGKKAALWPKHIEIKPLGENHAVAHYYIDGKVTEGDDTRQVMRRVSLVLGKVKGEWKILHWHASDMQMQDSERKG